MIGDSPQRVRRRAARRRRFVGQALAVLVAGVLLVSGAFASAVAVATGSAVPSAAGALMNSVGAPYPAGGSIPEVRPTVAARGGHLTAQRVAVAGELLARQSAAIRANDRRAYLATVDPRAGSYAATAADLFDNLQRMRVRQVRFGTPVVDSRGLTPARRAALGPSAWVASVELSFRLASGDTQPWRTTLRMAFVDRDGVGYVAGDREGQGTDSSLPLWMTERIEVVHGEHSMVAGSGHLDQLRRFARTADLAVRRVSEVWGSSWDQYIVVLVPPSQAQMERLIGVGSHTQTAVAAVTTSVGRPDPALASHIVVNPHTFDRIGSLGRLVVLTHEATHVAAHATVSGMPVWLSEGFADYVGFHRSGLPAEVIAHEFLSDVRRRGPPDALPGGTEFDPRARALDEAYESAWTACRYIAQRWDRAKLLRFYVAMDGARTKVDQERVYRRVLGTSSERFVQGWRAYVRERSDD
ncbi:hypothetical protein [Actinopolymorpha singaporensis]|uniref:Peptidase MA superfamily protein n=1 Tax=Actinopolymorpha singaporensis TaxID=117157 RepID=A0A1H1XAA5_9ACTN|nr:hypothetical protein [Actinopolymorpha singaporensis]SDT06215.1 hypothetical protein SAMN04489717_4888 [Actinopolymorpha singaporensis]